MSPRETAEDPLNPQEFFLAVEGTPVPQGSKNAYLRGDRVVLVEANKAHKP